MKKILRKCSCYDGLVYFNDESVWGDELIEDGKWLSDVSYIEIEENEDGTIITDYIW